MVELNPAAAQCHAEFLRRVIKHAHHDGNVALRALADARHPALRCATHADFHYIGLDPADNTPRTIPAAQFHRQYALCLQTLELTIHGYCVERRFGWERKIEHTFSTRRPPLWRRVLRPPPLLSLTVKAGPDDCSITLGAAQRRVSGKRPNYIVRLEPDMQEELARINGAQVAARSLRARLRAWFSRWRNWRG